MNFRKYSPFRENTDPFKLYSLTVSLLKKDSMGVDFPRLLSSFKYTLVIALTLTLRLTWYAPAAEHWLILKLTSTVTRTYFSFSVCQDIYPASFCSAQKYRCRSSSTIQQNCKRTCGACGMKLDFFLLVFCLFKSERNL